MVASNPEGSRFQLGVQLGQGDLLLAGFPQTKVGGDARTTTGLFDDDGVNVFDVFDTSVPLFAGIRDVRPDLAMDGAVGPHGVDKIEITELELAARLRASMVSDMPTVATVTASAAFVESAITWQDLQWADTPVTLSQPAVDDKPHQTSTALEPITVAPADEPEPEAQPEHIKVDAVLVSTEKISKPSKVIAFLGGAVQYAKQAKNAVVNRTLDAFAVRNESSHRLGRRTLVTLTAASLLLSSVVALTNHHPVKEKAAQIQEVEVKGYTPEQIAFMRSRMPEVDKTPAGAWVPAAVRVWEPAIQDLLTRPEMKQYDILADNRLILADVFASSLGDPDAQGLNGRKGLGQLTDEIGKRVDLDYAAFNAGHNLLATILVVDAREKLALLAADYKNDRAGLIHAVFEGQQPGQGYDPDPKSAKRLAANIAMLDADLGKPSSDQGQKWLADPDVDKLVIRATNNLLEQKILLRVKQ